MQNDILGDILTGSSGHTRVCLTDLHVSPPTGRKSRRAGSWARPDWRKRCSKLKYFWNTSTTPAGLRKRKGLRLWVEYPKIVNKSYFVSAQSDFGLSPFTVSAHSWWYWCKCVTQKEFNPEHIRLHYYQLAHGCPIKWIKEHLKKVTKWKMAQKKINYGKRWRR